MGYDLIYWQMKFVFSSPILSNMTLNWRMCDRNWLFLINLQVFQIQTLIDHNLKRAEH